MEEEKEEVKEDEEGEVMEEEEEEEKDDDDGRVSPSNPPQVLARPPKRLVPSEVDGLTRWTLPQ